LQHQRIDQSDGIGNTFALGGLLALAWAGPDGTLADLANKRCHVVVVVFICEVLPRRSPSGSRRCGHCAVAAVVSLLHSSGEAYGWGHARSCLMTPSCVQWCTAVVKPSACLAEGEYQELMEMAFQQGTLDASEKEIILQIIQLDRRPRVT